MPALLGAEAADDGEHSYAEPVDAPWRHGSQTRAGVQEPWRRIAFYRLATNADDHLRNRGFPHVDHDDACCHRPPP